MDITVLTGESTRTEIEEALGWCNTEAKRCLSRDEIGRPSERWAGMHAFLNHLLDMWQAAPLAERGAE